MEPGAQDTTLRAAFRTRWILLAIGAAAAAGTAAAAVWMYVSAPTLQGAVVTPPAPVYDFTLLDQDRRPIRLSQFRGKAVALTFLYTHCPDICPLIAGNLNTAVENLGHQGGQVAILAVTVDPEGDTPAAVRTFTLRHRLVPQFRWLLGTRRQLEPVWRDYNVLVIGRSAERIEHSAPILLLDRRGRPLLFYRNTVGAQAVLDDLRRLLRGERPSS